MIGIDFPQFRPHPLLRGGHAQTIAGVYFPGKLSPYAAQRHFVELEDGDRIVLHDDTPADWQPGGRVVLLVHGLGGCHSSPYMVRISAKLLARGARVFRIDLRGWGDGAETAKLPFHAARTADIAAALWFVDRLTHASPTALVGFSLGGNMVLKLLGDAGRSSRRSDSATNSSRNEAGSAEYLPVALDRAMAIAPPIDLLFCCHNLQGRMGRVYDRTYAKFLWNHLQSRADHVPAFAAAARDRPPQSIWEFDERFTAPLGGFASVEQYYAAATSHEVACSIEIPTLILSASDDPIVPGSLWQRIKLSAATRLLLTDRGGHLGFIAARSSEPDRRWMDWRVVDWVFASR